jgi:hypothetical protein
MTTWILLLMWSVVAIGTLVGLVLAWWRWSTSRQKTISVYFSLAGLVLATSSAILAIGTLIYAHAIGGFPFYDPLLLKIYRWGALLSVSAFLFGLVGIWKPHILRWYSPFTAAGTLLFWFIAASGE